MLDTTGGIVPSQLPQHEHTACEQERIMLVGAFLQQHLETECHVV